MTPIIERLFAIPGSVALVTGSSAGIGLAQGGELGAVEPSAGEPAVDGVDPYLLGGAVVAHACGSRAAEVRA